MQELYKVRRVTLSLLDNTSHEPNKVISCEAGFLIEKEGIIFLETHIFDDEDFVYFDYNILGCLASAKMESFNGVEIEVPEMAFVEKTSEECTITFKCYNFITVHEEQPYYAYHKSIDNEVNPSQLLRVDFWGLDLLVKSYSETQLMVSDAPFDMQLDKDKDKGCMYADFTINKEATHNTLTIDLYDLFRDSLVGYLSLINGARVQIVKEYYNSFTRIYSFNRIENLSRSYYACGNAKLYRPSPILFEFDNYVRWNKLLNLNKFVHHLCTAQQVLDYEDRSFILILALEDLSKQYLELQRDKIQQKIITQEAFEPIKTELLSILDYHKELNAESVNKIKEGIFRLNDCSLATYKFRLILDDLNIKRTKDINNLIKKVRSTIVHEAKLDEYADYMLLSELIRELILRLINSKVQRYSRFTAEVFEGKAPDLSYTEYLKQKNISINESAIISEYDARIQLRVKMKNN